MGAQAILAQVALARNPSAGILHTQCVWIKLSAPTGASAHCGHQNCDCDRVEMHLPRHTAEFQAAYAEKTAKDRKYLVKAMVNQFGRQGFALDSEEDPYANAPPMHGIHR